MLDTTIIYDGQLDNVNAFELGRIKYRCDIDIDEANPANIYTVNTFDDIVFIENFTNAFACGWEDAQKHSTKQEFKSRLLMDADNFMFA